MNLLNIVTNSNLIDWLELVIFLDDMSEAFNAKTENLCQVFTDITVIAPSERLMNFPDSIRWETYDKKEGRADLWNKKVKDTQKPWVLFLENGEDIDISDFPKKELLKANQWIPALIIQATGEETYKQYYQTRLVPKSGKPIFGGKNIPDATSHILENNISLSPIPIKLRRGTEPMSKTDPNDELSVQNFAPQLYLMSGNRYYEERKYVFAAAQYRRLLKMENLLPYDRLAAINGLAGCYVETYKWEKAIELAENSIEMEPMQYLPYLIQFRIYQLNKLWEKSLFVLEKYFEVLEVGSRANYDKYISSNETLLKLGKLAIKSGVRDKALRYYERYYRIKKGNVEPSFLEMLLVLSIELCDYEKSVYFFKEIFDEYIPDKLTEELKNKLNDYLSMFMVNGWYDYPFEVYDLLYEQESENGEYRRRLIVTLTKTNRIDKARRLIASNL